MAGFRSAAGYPQTRVPQKISRGRFRNRGNRLNPAPEPRASTPRGDTHPPRPADPGLEPAGPPRPRDPRADCAPGEPQEPSGRFPCITSRRFRKPFQGSKIDLPSPSWGTDGSKALAEPRPGQCGVLAARREGDLFQRARWGGR
ncbi:hypothetical protein LI90_686 [Carbonactinospora thermoautotrophica]|uniref:Uncharacterized protein n=1 Tax=Carbonactinospora thermoautotrophica TaxID=1469144 RepID=A0A132MMG8_9ACTN|nr:hypothetical protein LI90_686 [Carbonactinospora thermoautotrophica]